MTIAPEREAAPGSPGPGGPGPVGRTQSVGERRRSPSRLRATDVYALLGAAAAALSLTGLMFTRLLPFSGVVGFLVVEHGTTDAMFNFPQDSRTSDYVNDRFG
ncbi:hypothetical protein GCM10011583_42510 [Streptomyces camponoticapitis]|uniref:Uncharacterized protein n=1 Tax=Streptomyces camponoticapitis TaxID=1616125 RepID=A0ABQ2EGS0_9ACTN|nr:hypothetical protein [Streptomyces camponoticapitis]GGK06306.1 hypothetical protein GCM10011583_42510 [Streptomyces camponoticapitis]